MHRTRIDLAGETRSRVVELLNARLSRARRATWSIVMASQPTSAYSDSAASTISVRRRSFSS